MELILLNWLGILVISAICALCILHDVKRYCKKVRKNCDINTQYLSEIINTDIGKDISGIINQDGDELSDGEVVDAIVTYLKCKNLYYERVE